MRIIEINALSNGAHRNQTGAFAAIPDGWAKIPDEMVLPSTFPFVNVTAENGVVTSMEENLEEHRKFQKSIYNKQRIQELKDMLSATDYKAIKYAEGVLSEYEYASTKAQRQAWREEINALEAELEEMYD